MLTLIIVTKNRWAYMKRLLRYYASGHLSHRIHIGDSSDSEQYPVAEKVLRRVGGQLDINYERYPDLSNLECWCEMFNRVSTPYVATVADDDFVVPRGLDRAVEFLEQHADFSAAHGDALLLSLSLDGPHGSVSWVERYGQRSIEYDTASGRLMDHLGLYHPTIYSVHRTGLLQRSYRAVVDLKLDNSFGELLPSSLPVIRGKVKKLRTLYMVRQTHGDMTSRKLNLDLFDWISTPGWTSQWVSFRDCLATELAQQDRISVEQAREVVKQAFWAHLARGLTGKWHARYGRAHDGWQPRFRNTVRQIPGLRRAWHAMRGFLPGEGNQMSLPALLRPSSAYYAEFMPVYRMLTTIEDPFAVPMTAAVAGFPEPSLK